MSEHNKTCKKDEPASYCEMHKMMGDFTPNTLKVIKDLTPDFVDVIKKLDETILMDGALDRKTKRLIALACVCVRSCYDCVYAQAKVAKNYGATKGEILEAVQVSVLTGGVPCWSVAKKGILRLFEEWDEEE